MTVRICMCTARSPARDTFVSCLHLMRRPPEGLCLDMSIVSGDACIDKARSTAASLALALDEPRADWLFWLDDDMVFLPQHVDMLMRSAEKLGPCIISGAASRRAEGRGIAVTWDPTKPAGRIGFGVPEQEPVEVAMVGSAFTLVHRDVYEAVAKHRPVFIDTQNGDIEVTWYYQPTVTTAFGPPLYASEDMSFCSLARELGFKVWLAPAVAIGHVGERIYWVKDGLGQTKDVLEKKLIELWEQNQQLLGKQP